MGRAARKRGEVDGEAVGVARPGLHAGKQAAAQAQRLFEARDLVAQRRAAALAAEFLGEAHHLVAQLGGARVGLGQARLEAAVLPRVELLEGGREGEHRGQREHQGVGGEVALLAAEALVEKVDLLAHALPSRNAAPKWWNRRHWVAASGAPPLKSSTSARSIGSTGIWKRARRISGRRVGRPVGASSSLPTATCRNWRSKWSSVRWISSATRSSGPPSSPSGSLASASTPTSRRRSRYSSPPCVMVSSP